MFDVFYIGRKPGLFAHEKSADSIQHACEQSRTRYCWIINYLSDYTGFDFLWEPSPWQANQRHAWASQWQKDSGTYLVPRSGYTDTNYHAAPVIQRLPALDSWEIPPGTDIHDFDFSWHPDPTEPAMRYQFGTQHQRTGGPAYVVGGATDIKFVDLARVTKWSCDDHWDVPPGLDLREFDWTWHPDDRDPAYIYQFGTQHQATGGPRYCVPGAREIKYISIARAQRTAQDPVWEIPPGIDVTGFDFTWHPDDRDPPYIYQFGTQHQATGGPRYRVAGATEIKYVPVQRAIRTDIDDRWQRPDTIDIDEFDWTWHPDDRDPAYIYQFGTQHQATGGPVYTVPGATEIKYVPVIRARKITIDNRWTVPDGLDISDFDFTWHPDATEQPYIYQFGTQHQPTGGPVYTVPGAVSVKYVPVLKARRTHCDDCWTIPDTIDVESFDFTWHPDATEQPYIYQFGTQHQPTGGPRYTVPGAVSVKYVPTPRAHKITRDPCWIVPANMNTEAFDWTWHPDDREQPYRYQFPTQWNRAGGPEYVAAGATDIKFVSVQVARMLPTDRNWIIPDGIDINSFDFSWTPDPTEPPYVYEFGTQWQKTGGPCYHVPGATERKYVALPRATRTAVDTCWQTPAGIEDFDYTWHPDATEQPYIYEFGTQWQKTGGPRYVMPGAQEVKYVPTPRAEKTTRDQHWEIPEGADVETFDWTWHPDSTEQPYIYQFGTQHQRTGGPRYRTPGATDIKYVDQIRIRTQRVATAIIEIDHMDGNAGHIPDTTKTSRYFDNYLDTLRRIAKNLGRDHEFVWICSSICDYTDFDFSWHPEQWQASMLHVFASDGEKFGDTFFMHVPTFQYRSENTKLLEWYDVNFVEGVSVPRRPLPIVRHEHDTHVEAIKTQSWSGPLAVFATPGAEIDRIPPVPLWREKTKTVVPLSQGASSVIVPKVAVPQIRTQVYDYPYVDKTYRSGVEQPMDVVFISNGESNAAKNWAWLNTCLAGRANQVHRVDGINGRVAAYQAAARASTTPWFFAVFAKLEVEAGFDWAWQPDRLQQPKHYIFHARNPVNHLCYGHMAMIAYNRSMTLTNTAPGLDFTLDQEHEVVPVISGTAHYDSDPWMTWRTAFREAIKLRHSLPDVENEYRLQQWLTMGHGVNGTWSVAGAQDAVEYYEEVSGDFAELRKTYEWAWLASYALLRRNLAPSQ